MPKTPWSTVQLVLKGLYALLQKRKHIAIADYAGAHTHAHTHAWESSLHSGHLTWLVCCRTCHVSPYFKFELLLIKAQALSLAAAQPRCAAPGRNHSNSIIWLSPSLPGFSSPSRSSDAASHVSSTLTLFFCPWEELVHLKCSCIEKEQIISMMDFYFEKMKKVSLAFICGRMFYS